MVRYSVARRHLPESQWHAVALSLPGQAHGVEFLSLHLIRQYAQDIKNRGHDFIDYNIESGTVPPEDAADPVASIRAAAQAAHAVGLKFKVSPSYGYLEQYYREFVQAVDSVHIQVQRFQDNPTEFEFYTKDWVTKLRAEKPNLQHISIQISLSRAETDSTPLATLQESARRGLLYADAITF